jgi:predicted anti-sigma-YlaC factor YlaD
VKFVGRLIILAVLIVPFGLPLLLIPWTLDLAVLVLIKNLLPSVLCGFSMYAFSGVLWKKFNLDCP